MIKTEYCIPCKNLNGKVNFDVAAYDADGTAYCNSHGRMSSESIALEHLCGVAWKPRTIIMVYKMEDKQTA